MHRVGRMYNVLTLNLVAILVAVKLCKVKSELKLLRNLKVFTVRVKSFGPSPPITNNNMFDRVSCVFGAGGGGLTMKTGYFN
jgi:hypothetical protein